MRGMNGSPLDRPMARWIALSIFVAMLLLLGAIQRNGPWMPAETPTNSLNKNYVLCLNERLGTVEKMMSEGVIDQNQASLFKTRADALCRTKFPPN